MSNTTLSNTTLSKTILPKTTPAKLLSTFAICYGFWLLVTWSLAWQELVAGAVVCLAVAWFCGRFFICDSPFLLLRPRHLSALICFCLVIFPTELFHAAFGMMGRCLSVAPINPGIVKIPVHLNSQRARAMLANSITLTPGTITMDIVEEEDGLFYYVHWVDVTETDPVKAGYAIKGRMEIWIRRIWD